MKARLASPPLFFAFLSLILPTVSFGQAKIVGGSKAPANTYHWIVALASAGGDSLYDRQFCGGSLIAPNWVLTAAHCVEDKTAARLQVAIGLTDLNDSTGAEIRGVRGIFIHPAYGESQGDLFNDVALLLLDAPVNTIAPVTIARDFNSVSPGTTVRALGWGDTRSTPKFPTELRMVDLDITSLNVANRAYGITTLDRRHLAAMASGKDTCGGDSGGPLFDADGDSGNPLLVGITSYGLDCAVKNIPGIYANVGNFAPLIDGFLAETLIADPSLTVSGGGVIIPNGNRAASTRNGTSFGRPVRAGRTVTRRFTVANGYGGTPLSISSVKISNRNFTTRGAPTFLLSGRGASVAVSFRGPATGRRGIMTGRLSIRSSDPLAPSYSFQLAARFVGR